MDPRAALPARARRIGWLAPRAGARLVVLSALLSVGCGEADEPSRGKDGSAPRNLILIVVDTLRADYIGANGGPVATPTIDALAASGVLFREARAQIPMTGPSHGSLFTALLPSDHGTISNSQAFSEANLTMAEILQEHGWRTAAFVSLGVLKEQFNFDQGFDEYSNWFQGRWWKSADVLNSELLRWVQQDLGRPTFLFLHYSDPHTPYAPPDVDYPQVTLGFEGQVLAVLSANARATRIKLELQPGDNDLTLSPPDGVDRGELGSGLVTPSDRQVKVQFSYGAGFEPGLDDGRVPPLPTLPHVIRLVNPTDEPLRVNLDLTLRVNLSVDDWPTWYAREVAYIDAELGRAIDALKQAGLWEDSVVIFTSDHGEGLGQHGLKQHIDQLYDSLLRVPLIVSAPGRLPAGTVVDVPVQHMDVLPTVLDLLELPLDRPLRGRSLVPLASGEGSAAARAVLGQTHRPEAKHDLRSLVLNGFKYIVDTGSGAEELYALADDPGELQNLAGERPDILARMRSEMAEQYALAFGPDVPPGEWQALSEEERARMAELGY
jgi:arylsulfatase A-like enzyme